LSKRFGRNQRRRAREALASAVSDAQNWRNAYTLNAELVRHTSEKLSEVREELD